VARSSPGRRVLLDPSEFALYAIHHDVRENHGALARVNIIGNVRDRQTVFRLMGEMKPEIIFHAAALKHVPLIESNICEGVLTNVIGTRHVGHAAVEIGVKAMVMISTDKAIRPKPLHARLSR
jgi:FlaA1/EpsC-like NDP-sugar epimerase